MFTSELLTPGHVVEGFDCGNDELDGWLRSAAYTAQRAGTARTYVWPGDDGEVLAYFAVAPTSVALAAIPSSLSRGAPDPMRGFLIAKLARHLRLRGGGHGEVLLVDALDVVVCAAAMAGGRVVVVDAIDGPPRSSTNGTGFVAPIPAVTALCSR